MSRALFAIAIVLIIGGGAVAIARFVQAGRVTRPMMDADSPGRRTNLGGAAGNLPAAKPNLQNDAPPANNNVPPPIGQPMVKTAVRNLLPALVK